MTIAGEGVMTTPALRATPPKEGNLIYGFTNHYSLFTKEHPAHTARPSRHSYC